MVHIKSPEEIEQMRPACRLAADTLVMIEPHIRPGITTDEINELVHEYTIAHDAYPSPLNYHGFPKSVCTSVNHVVCHGIPGPKKLKEGDIINVSDIGFIGSGMKSSREESDDLHAALRAFEKEQLYRVLCKCSWNKVEAAKALGIGLSSLYRKLDELEISAEKSSQRRTG